MRKLTFVFGSLVLALCSMNAQAQMPDPTVQDTQFAAYDIGALKAGEWVEYSMEAYGQKYSYKYACVGVEGDTVYIEYADMGLAMMHKGTVILVAVNKGDRKVTKAWWGKPGEKGKSIEVKATPAAGAGTPGETPKMKGKGKVSKEKCNVAGKDFDCEKLEMEITTTVQGKDYVSKSSVWMAENVPFKNFVDEKADPAKAMGDITWEGKPSGKGTMVKTESEMMGQKSVIALSGTGTDAKQTLQK